jgi:hypothetical protein
MKIPWFDIVLIVVLTTIVAALNQFELLAEFSHFILIPLLGMYYLGVWVGRKKNDTR